jgi:hypothetical protein
LGKAKITGFRKLVHAGLLPSGSERWHPVRAGRRRIAGWVAKTRPECREGNRWVWLEPVGGLHPAPRLESQF